MSRDHERKVADEMVRRGGLFGQRHIPIRYLAPNLVTLLSLAAGATAIRIAIEGRVELAVGLIVIAAVLDAMDGRLARAFNAQSRFGAELDSLADFVSFGVAPALVLYFWALKALGAIGWIVALVFAVAAGLRLARFNAMLDEPRPKWQSDFFTGVPAPAGALLVMLPIYLGFAGLASIQELAWLIGGYTVVIAGLLVSTLPTYSGKLIGERIAREYVAPALIVAALAVAVLVAYPFVTLSLGSLAYLVLIPVGVRAYVTKLGAEGRDEPTATAAAPPEGDTGGRSDWPGSKAPGQDETRH